MRKKGFHTLILPFLFASGSFFTINAEDINIDKITYTIGNSDTAIKSFHLTYSDNGKITHNIVAYIDQFPTKIKFNLCDDYVKGIDACESEVRITENNNLKAPYHVYQKIVLPTKINKRDKELMSSYKVESGLYFKIDDPLISFADKTMKVEEEIRNGNH